MLTSLKSNPRCYEWEPWEFLRRTRVGTFWGHMYWALNIHEETASLPLETYGEESRGATVAEALEVSMSPMYMQSGMASETFILLQILMLGPDKRWLVRSII
jgi:hypothetical protein